MDFTQAFSGPFCTMMLADNGARVIKIEKKITGDMLRDAGPFDDDHNSLYFASGNRGKESVELDLTDSNDIALVKAIIKDADILVENFRPGVMAKLGLSYEDVIKINPKIIYTSISGFGQTGPRKHEPGFDMIAQGYSGLMSVNGELHGKALRVGVSIGDMNGGLFAYMGTMTALYAREKNEKGSHVDISMTDGLFALMPPQVANYSNTGKIETTCGNAHPAIAPFGVVATADGEIIISILGKKLWHAFCDLINRPEIEMDERFKTNELRLKNRNEFRKIERPILKTKTSDEWISLFQKAGIPCARINNIKEACEMEQIKARNMLCKAGDYILAGNPMKMSGYSDDYVKGKIPDLGEHTDKIRNEFK